MKYLFISMFLLVSLEIFGQESKGKFIGDEHTDCMVWDENYTPGDSISWEGNCNNKLAEGSGTLIWYAHGKEISRYEGYMLEGVPSGKGKYTYANGSIVEGNFLNGVFLNLGKNYFQQLKKNKVSNSDEGNVFINDGTSKSLFYYSLSPKDKVSAVLVLFPSTSETAEEVLSNNAKLVEGASNKGVLVVIPSVNNHLVLDENLLEFFSDCFSDVIERYQAPKDKFIFGGLSMGALLSIRYAELSKENAAKNLITPKAIFAADPPLDFSKLYRQYQKDVALNFSPSAMEEAKFFLAEMNKVFGGTPEQQSVKYASNSIFSSKDKNGGNAQFLKNIPLRIYSDPDTSWQKANRKREYVDTNAADQTAMIDQLKSLGNSQAEFVNAMGKGYRLDGKRNPQSWSIIDATDCLNWISKFIQ